MHKKKQMTHKTNQDRSSCFRSLNIKLFKLIE